MTNYIVYTPFAAAVAGLLLLFLGRKLFWFFVAVAGFLVGLQFAAQYFRGPTPIVLLIALAAGIIGAVLAVLVQRVAVAAAGFIAGGYILTALMGVYTTYPANWTWAVYIIGGIIGAILVLFVFDWALIVLTSLGGAYLVIGGLRVHGTWMGFAYLALVVIGILVQASLLRTTAVS